MSSSAPGWWNACRTRTTADPRTRASHPPVGRACGPPRRRTYPVSSATSPATSPPRRNERWHRRSRRCWRQRLAGHRLEIEICFEVGAVLGWETQPAFVVGPREPHRADALPALSLQLAPPASECEHPGVLPLPLRTLHDVIQRPEADRVPAG